MEFSKEAFQISAPATRQPGNQEEQKQVEGECLGSPNRQKQYQRSGRLPKSNAKSVSYAALSVQGWRPSNEDELLVVPSLLKHNDAQVSLLGVFDGHGGQDTSHYLRENFGQRLCERLRANKFNYTLSLEETFEALDAEIVGLGFEAGSTATVCVITKDVIYFAQAGDSRAFVYSQGHGGAIRVTQEHLPTLPKEKARIEAAGGYVRRERVNGVLSMSRAFGNSEFKDNKKLTSQEQIVVVHPDVSRWSFEEDGELQYLVLLCDGVWEGLSEDDIVVHLQKCADQPMDAALEHIVDDILQKSYKSDDKGWDNMSIIAVRWK